MDAQPARSELRPDGHREFLGRRRHSQRQRDLGGQCRIDCDARQCGGLPVAEGRGQQRRAGLAVRLEVWRGRDLHRHGGRDDVWRSRHAPRAAVPAELRPGDAGRCRGGRRAALAGPALGPADHGDVSHGVVRAAGRPGRHHQSHALCRRGRRRVGRPARAGRAPGHRRAAGHRHHQRARRHRPD